LSFQLTSPPQSPPAAHVSDVVALYALLVEKILSGKEKIPSGEAGYYFAIAHRHAWWDVMARLAQSLHRRGLVEEPIAKTWPSYEMAAESLGWPLQYIVPMGMSKYVSLLTVHIHVIERS
jgi:predicted DNA-binding transcriptional regulator